MVAYTQDRAQDHTQDVRVTRELLEHGVALQHWHTTVPAVSAWTAHARASVQTGLPPYPNCVKVQPNRNMAMSTSLMATRKGTVAHPERPQGNSRGLDCCGNCIRRDICNDAIAVVNLVGERHDPHTPTCLGHCCCWRHLSTGGCTDVWV